jgi:ABC-type lipoprotein export system ATPase subunit
VTDHAIVSAAAVGYDVGRRTLWNGLELRLRDGEALALRGRSGSGKSTLLRCVGGIDRPHRGTVRIDGVDLASAAPRIRRRLRRDVLGFVMQDHGNVPEWSVEQNLRVLRLVGVTRAALDARIQAALLMVGLGGRARERVSTLSGGEQQRVSVARVLVQRPRVVLADEPTASLDEESAARVRLALDALRADGSAVIVATHDPGLAEWADRVLDLDAPAEHGARTA